MRTKFIAAIFLLLPAAPLIADVQLPAIFADHMVLQRDTKVPMWGWADPGEVVKVSASGATASATAGADRKWKLSLDGLKASNQPIDVSVAGKNSIVLRDVLVGDVWVCSGQSNMEFQLGGGKYGFGGALNSEAEIAKADHPTMRLFVVKRKIALEPQDNCEGIWKICTPDSAARFSAVGYFFARDILDDQHVPVGMIGTYWGGTVAEAWTSLEMLKSVSKLNVLAKKFEGVKSNLPERKQAYDTELMPKWKAAKAAWQRDYGTPYEAAEKKWMADVATAKASGAPLPAKPVLSTPTPHRPDAPDADPNLPTVLSNGMISPIVSYGIKGVIWYQGESNAGACKLYQTLFPAMITDWRTRWGQGNFPFIWVQLANYTARFPEPTQTSDTWPGLREAQSMTLKLPASAQTVTIDIGQGDDIHPKDKLDVGHRLSLAARHVAYGEDLVFSGPTYDSMQIDGASVTVKFKNVGAGLTIAAGPSTQPDVPQVPPADQLKGFTIAGSDHKFVWATAKIDGDNVIVSSPDVPDPKAVRYGWANNPEVNLYNKNGLPASPFRTDDWMNPTVK